MNGNETLTGKIISLNGGLYTVAVGADDYLCRARGSFRHNDISPAVGDDAVILPERDGDYAITELLPRKNSLIRPPLCNLDMLFICVASAEPEPSALTADKLVTIAEHNGIEPVLIFTKSDLDNTVAASLALTYIRCGFDAFTVSALTEAGIDRVREYIESKCAGRLSAVAGVSGAGKSTLLNALFPTLSQQVGAVSYRIGRGRNTTRLTELFRLSKLCRAESGFLADTPGFSMLDFVRFNFYAKEDLPFVFREFEPYLTKCRYTKCTHTKEDGCAIIEAVQNGIIPQSRHDSYAAIYANLKDKHSWDKSPNASQSRNSRI